MRRSTTPRSRGALILGACCVVLSGLAGLAAPASAKILKTRRPVQPGRELELTVGSGVEFETDSEHTQFDFPFLLEYGLTNSIKLSAEPSYVVVHEDSGGSVSGLGDLETTLNWEFLGQRRNRLGLALEGVVKWPTANTDIGTGKTDFSIGAIASKDFVPVDFDLNAVYTFVGSPAGTHLENTIELSLAAEWRLSTLFDVEAEVLTAHGAGGFRGQPGTIGGLGGPEQGTSETEGTLGLAEHLNDFLKLEEGMILKSDGSWQAVLAWEWDFAGD